ncbi:hypothetical protein BGW39_011505, partial [Mortierella sp. 14UC]
MKSFRATAAIMAIAILFSLSTVQAGAFEDASEAARESMRSAQEAALKLALEQAKLQIGKKGAENGAGLSG